MWILSATVELDHVIHTFLFRSILHYYDTYTVAVDEMSSNYSLYSVFHVKYINSDFQVVAVGTFSDWSLVMSNKN